MNKDKEGRHPCRVKQKKFEVLLTFGNKSVACVLRTLIIVVIVKQYLPLATIWHEWWRCCPCCGFILLVQSTKVQHNFLVTVYYPSMMTQSFTKRAKAIVWVASQYGSIKFKLICTTLMKYSVASWHYSTCKRIQLGLLLEYKSKGQRWNNPNTIFQRGHEANSYGACDRKTEQKLYEEVELKSTVRQT